MTSKNFNIFSHRQDQESLGSNTGQSRLMKNILAAAEHGYAYEQQSALPIKQPKANGNPHIPSAPNNDNKAIPKRPSSANPIKKQHRSSRAAGLEENDRFNKSSRDDLIAEVLELKKKVLAQEENASFLKSENQRLEMEAIKQQRRIDQLMNLSEGVKSSNTTQIVRKEIEKSILVRQLKSQLTMMRNTIAEKDNEIEALKRDMRFSHCKEVEIERDEFYAEIQRLKKVNEDHKEELNRERQRREWNNKLAGETGDDLRKELARLASGYQNILANITTRPSSRPSTASGVRTDNTKKGANAMQRPASANSTPNAGRFSPTKEDRRSRDISETAAVQSNEISGDWLGHFQPAEAGAELANESQRESQQNAMQNISNWEPKRVAQPVQNNARSSPSKMNKPSGSAGGVSFRVNDRVQALFHGGPQYFHGIIKAMNPNGTFHVLYDDNDEENNVPVSLIRPSDKPRLPGTAVAISAPAPAPMKIVGNKFSVGQKIEALYYNGSTWYPGEIKAVLNVPAKNGFVYDVVYSDGDREKQVVEANIRDPIAKEAEKPVETGKTSPVKPGKTGQNAVSSPKAVETAAASVANPIYKANDQVKGNFKGEGAWYPAKVTSFMLVHGKYNYNLTYDDGDVEKNVSEENIMPREANDQKKSSKQVTQDSGTSFSKGDVVESFIPKYDHWFGGEIVRVNNNGTYFIKYDDGDEDKSVDSSRIRKKFVVVKGEYYVGDCVEAKFQGANVWYSGKVIAKNAGPPITYKVKYDDDGAIEDGVKVELIRLIVKENSPNVDNIAPSPVKTIDKNSPKKAHNNQQAIRSSDQQRRPTTTNLDSFLNDLSDDDDGAVGGLDAGHAVQIGMETHAIHKEASNCSDYNEEFDA